MKLYLLFCHFIVKEMIYNEIIYNRKKLAQWIFLINSPSFYYMFISHPYFIFLNSKYSTGKRRNIFHRNKSEITFHKYVALFVSSINISWPLQKLRILNYDLFYWWCWLPITFNIHTGIYAFLYKLTSFLSRSNMCLLF